MSGTPVLASVPWWRSVRTQIMLAVTIISLVVSGLVGYVLAERSATAAREAVRSEAFERLRLASDGYALDGKLRYGATVNSPSVALPIRTALADTSKQRQVSYYDSHIMWAGARLGPHVVLTLALDARTLKDQDGERMQALGVAALVAAASSAALGIAAGTTLSRRLRRAAHAATEISQGNSTVRARQPGRDEVTSLTQAVDEMAASLQARLQVEKEFTSDVAHELRTPLTGLVSAAELLPDGPMSDLVRQQVGRLRRLVEDLLEISRLDRAVEPHEHEYMNLGQAVRASLLRLDAPEGLTLEIRSSTSVLVEPRRLDRVLGNLIANMVRHAGGRGRLVVEDTQLTLSDDGKGYPADLLRWGPRPFHAEGESKGSGLGLSIAMKNAAHMHASLTLSNSPLGGAQACVVFATRSDDLRDDTRGLGRSQPAIGKSSDADAPSGR